MERISSLKITLFFRAIANPVILNFEINIEKAPSGFLWIIIINYFTQCMTNLNLNQSAKLNPVSSLIRKLHVGAQAANECET